MDEGVWATSRPLRVLRKHPSGIEKCRQFEADPADHPGAKFVHQYLGGVVQVDYTARTQASATAPDLGQQRLGRPGRRTELVPRDHERGVTREELLRPEHR